MSLPSLSLTYGPVSAAAPGPLYEQVVAAVKREVAGGRLKPGDALPSLRTLAAELMVSLITVKRAYEDLERDGIIYSRQGLGAFIADGGPGHLKREKTQAARTALCEAINAGRAAGLSKTDLLDMLKTEFDGGNQ